MGGGDSNVDIIEYITIANTGNMTDFGNLLAADYRVSACCSGTRAICIGGDNAANTLQYVTIASTGNAQDFGDLIASHYEENKGPGDTNGSSNCHGGL